MDKMQREHYEELFNRLLERGENLHAANQKRIRIGLIFLGVFTLGMIVVRYITDSDRATFLMIWVVGMFLIAIYLIGIEFIDSSIEKTLEDVTERESGWSELFPDSEVVRGRIQDRVQDRRDEVREVLADRRSEIEDSMRDKYSAMVEDMMKTGSSQRPPESEDEE